MNALITAYFYSLMGPPGPHMAHGTPARGYW